MVEPPLTTSGKLEMIPLDYVRLRLGTVWLVFCAVIVLTVVVQSYLGHFANADGDKSADAWNWLLPTIVPTLGMILSTLGFSALSADMSATVVRRGFYSVAIAASVFYLALVFLTIIIQPFTSVDPISLMRKSNLWLGPLQGLVASVLGVLFVSKETKKSA